MKSFELQELATAVNKLKSLDLPNSEVANKLLLESFAAVSDSKVFMPSHPLPYGTGMWLYLRPQYLEESWTKTDAKVPETNHRSRDN